MTSQKYPKGSEWRKWDLHVHSPLTILNNQYPKLTDGSPDWEAFISKLESLDVAVLGITDYFTIDGYKKLKEYKQQGRLQNIHTILPNIEFRLNSVLSSKKDGQEPRRLNFHVIFSDAVSPQDIEEHFLHDISFFYEGNPQDKDGTRKLKPSNIEDLGKKLISEHQKFKDSGLSPMVIGATQTVVNHEDITEALKDSRFKGKYIVVFPEELSNLISWDGQDHHTRKGLLQKSDMVFSSNEKTQAWCLGQSPYEEGIQKYIEEFKTLKSCIHGSDAHKIGEIGHPCSLRGNKGHACDNGGECKLRHCWLKADPTFEGLKQLLYEPADRVAIQEEKPVRIKSNYTISKFKISQATIADDLSIQETEIELNPGLVAVTGGKGGGKTAFVDLIANCYRDRCNIDDRNSFVRRISDQNPSLGTTITFKNGDEFSKQLCDGSFFEDSDIVYIAQGELESYIGADSDLDAYIKNLIFSSPQIKDTVKNHEFDELIVTIEELQEQVSKKHEVIISLEQQTSADVQQAIALESKQKEAELKDVANKVTELEKAQSKEKIKIAQDKQKAIAELKSKKDDLTSLKTLLTKVITFIENDLTTFNTDITAINVLLKKLELPEQFDSISYKTEGLETRLVNTKGEITTIVQSIETAQKELEQFEAGVKDHAKLLEKKRELDVAIANIKIRQEDFAKNQASLTQAIDDRRGLMQKLVGTVVSQKIKYEELISLFSAHKADVLSDLTFGARIQFDRKEFLQTAEDVMDNRKVIVNPKNGEPTLFSNLFTLVESILDGKESDGSKLVDEIEKINRENKDKLKRSQTVSVADFYRFLYFNYFTVVPTVKYKNTQLSKLSLGQKATVLIKIYLAQGDKPIIIDSHDDHLDNEFIMDELVKAIRQAKEYRQVILASNNGNVVINSDAEQIIIAHRNDGEISYIAGSIEEPSVRDRAVKVLEGGSEAFKQRQQKYRLNS